jgi:tetratricopeptide (TPR) repeat protein
MAEPYQTNWSSSSWDKTLKYARGKEHGVVLYFAPQSTATEHRVFKTKTLSDVSKERFFFKVKSGDDKKMRALFEPDPRLHAVFVCDYWGNEIKRWEAKPGKKIPSKSVRSSLMGVGAVAKRLAKSIKSKAEAAGKSIEKEEWDKAAKTLRPLLRYRGYEGVKQIHEGWKQVEKGGLELLAAALRMEDKAARDAELRDLRKRFAGTEVEKRCDAELAGKKPESQSARPAPEQWAAEAEDPCEAAMRAGIAHERAGRYVEAEQCYLRAAVADPLDPVPLVYLGEVYRHHLGRWEDARAQFERVLALELDGHDHAVAIALHGIGKMTIWGGDNEAGLKYFARSIARHPTPLCYRNLAVYWNTEGEAKKAYAYARKAFELDPDDSYNQVFYSVYLLGNGEAQRAAELIRAAEFHPSMSYNYACYHALRGEKDLVLKYLKRHFYEYESCDAVRRFEMAEARMDGFFKPWHEDPAFRKVTELAAATPWLK